MQSVSSWNRTRPVLSPCGGILRPALDVTVSTERALFTPNEPEPERSEITDELHPSFLLFTFHMISQYTVLDFGGNIIMPWLRFD